MNKVKSTVRAWHMGGCALSILAAAVAGHASAQAVEHNNPVVPPGKTVLVAPPNMVPASQDATPLGTNLKGIVILGATDAVHTGAGTGLDLGSGNRLQNDSRARTELGHFIGQPLSRRLIAEVQATIARAYRRQGFPFVSLSTPEQDVTSGVLQIRVVEFVAGNITVHGAASSAEAQHVAGAVRQKSGEPINADLLNQDLAWLNHYPFHQVQAVFSPGNSLGVSDLSLNETEAKNWTIYGGYNNAGSPSTGLNRYFAGASVGNLLGADSVLSYQGTSGDGRVNGHGRYISNAVNYTLPVGRGQVEASLDQVETNQSVTPFAVRLTDVEGSAGYRFTLSGFPGDRAQSDVRAGVEIKHEAAKTFFVGTDVYDASMNVDQLYLGYHRAAFDSMGMSDLDLVLHANPGSGESKAAVMAYSLGRMKSNTYGYLGLTYNRTTNLPGRITLNTMAVGQLAGAPLPRSEQAGLGGAYLVRGYSLDDGAYDTAFVLRNELRPAPGAYGTGPVNPFVFVDIGYGRDNYTKLSHSLASAGVGASVYLTGHVALNFDVARPLQNAPVTRSGDWKLDTSLSLRF